MPVYFDRFHSPCRSAACAGETCRAAASISATASSAAETMLEVGALTTMTPEWVAVRTSTLSSPTPARATTLSRGAAASASASTLVAERTRIASASAIAASSSARSAPLQCRISKSGPSASTVAGLSSSAIRTTGLLTAGVLKARMGGTRTTLCRPPTVPDLSARRGILLDVRPRPMTVRTPASNAPLLDALVVTLSDGRLGFSTTAAAVVRADRRRRRSSSPTAAPPRSW